MNNNNETIIEINTDDLDSIESVDSDEDDWYTWYHLEIKPNIPFYLDDLGITKSKKKVKIKFMKMNYTHKLKIKYKKCHILNFIKNCHKNNNI